MDFDRAPRILSGSPTKKLQAQRNCRGIQSEYFVGNIHIGNRFISVHRPDLSNQIIAKIGEYLAIPVFICTGQGRLVYIFPDSQMVQLASMGLQANTDIPKRVTRGQLAEEQLDELVPAIEIPCPEITVILCNVFLKLVPVYKLQKLRKNIFP
jgi:hypothetical protein